MKIDPQQVVELYKKHHFKPCIRDIIPKTNPDECCALGILYFDEFRTFPSIVDIDNVYKWAIRKFGDNFVGGFWLGFDGRNPLSERPEQDEFTEGYQNGLEVSKVVFAAYREGKI